MKTTKHPARKSKRLESPSGAKLHQRTARRWRKAGTNPDDPAQVRDRLLDAKNVPEETGGETKRDANAIPPPDVPALSGTAGIAARLESDVQHLRARLKQACGDVVLERAIRRQLLAAESELRKFYDSNPDAGTSGEVMPRAEVERLLETAAYCFRIAARGLDPFHADATDAKLLHAFAGFMANHCPGMSAPDWALEAIKSGLTGRRNDPALDAWFAAFMGLKKT